MKHHWEDLLQKWESPVSECLVASETAYLDTLTVEECHQLLRRQTFTHQVQYFYIIDVERHLKGIVSARTLLLADPHVKLRDLVMEKPIAIHHTLAVGKALELAMQHELLAFPVEDEKNHFIGIFEIPVKELLAMHGPSHKAGLPSQKQLFQMMGLTIQKKRHTGIGEFIHRMPWLFCNLAGGLICAWIASDFGDVLTRFVILSFFIPLVLTLGESIAMQSMTLAISAFISRATLWRAFKTRLNLEIRGALMLGATSALVVAGLGFFWPDELRAILAVALSVAITMVIVALYGLIIPAILKWNRLEPRVAAGPFILMITDITITAIYLFVSYFILMY